jgi:DNA-binding transcriptional MerR regulator
MIIQQRTWKVGELAKRTKLTVRTLHHYDQIGLLTPSQYSKAGHRLYTVEDIQRLQMIVSLKQLGFSLSEIKTLLDQPTFDSLEMIQMQIKNVKEFIHLKKELLEWLEKIYDLLRSQQDVTVEELIKLIEMIHLNSKKYFTPKQLDKLKKQSDRFTFDEKKRIDLDWSELVSKIRAEFDQHTPPDHPKLVPLAKRWQELTDHYTGGDPEVLKGVERFYAEHPMNSLPFGIDGELYKYIKKAISMLKS